MTQVMKLIHLDPQEIYDGSWKEHDLDRRESYAIEVEARYKRETITREHIFSQSDAQWCALHLYIIIFQILITEIKGLANERRMIDEK